MPTPYIASQHHADASRGQAEMAHRIGYEHRELQEPGGVEDELRDEHRPQQRVMEDEGGALADVLERMALRRGCARRLVDTGEQHHGDG
jgi:hypothetical protein